MADEKDASSANAGSGNSAVAPVDKSKVNTWMDQKDIVVLVSGKNHRQYGRLGKVVYNNQEFGSLGVQFLSGRIDDFCYLVEESKRDFQTFYRHDNARGAELDTVGYGPASFVRAYQKVIDDCGIVGRVRAFFGAHVQSMNTLEYEYKHLFKEEFSALERLAAQK